MRQFKLHKNDLIRLKEDYFRLRPKLIKQVGDMTCALCGEEANSLHHLLPLGYCLKEHGYYFVANEPWNLIPCCMNWHKGKNCHFRLNGVSWCFISVNADLFGVWTAKQWADAIRNWIIEHRELLLKHRASELKHLMKVPDAVHFGHKNAEL